MTPLEFAQLLMLVASRYNASVTSWGRSDARNLAVGGKASSRHRCWLAADVVLDDRSLDEEALVYAQELGLHGLVEKGCLHLQDRAVVK